MKKTVLLLMVFISLRAAAQQTPTEMAQPVVAEGKRLYRSEMASWYGTDIFVKAHPDTKTIGGYFSYTEGDNSKCIFFSKRDAPAVIGSILFDSTYNLQTAVTNLEQRAFTIGENDIYLIRKEALAAINSDTLFKKYDNTNLNLVPLIFNGEKKVYVLTGPEKNGVVIFGNDYLLTFSNDNKLTGAKQLHRNIMPINFQKNGAEKDQENFGSIHSHSAETGDFITATDICTLMLYGKFTGWKQHNVVSEKYLNIWNCDNNQLTVLLKSALDKNEKDQQKSKKNKKEE